MTVNTQKFPGVAQAAALDAAAADVLTASQAAWLASRRLPARGWPAYESLKRRFIRQFPDATEEQYTAAMDRIAEMAGV